ncbi:MAG: hypothetical protein HZB92_07645 [Euryarchaeota archaeon]|nr:hypothetical protein [Euryarchaeota archaeon]
MSARFSLVKTCSADAFDAIPRRLTSVDISRAVESLKRAGYSIVADAGRLCVVEKDGREMTLYSSGRVLVKTGDEEEARRAAEELYACIG